MDAIDLRPLSGKSILISGATGLLGGAVLRRLEGCGARLSALVRNPQRAAHLAERGVRLVQGDLSDPAGLAEAAAGQQIIFHCAGAVIEFQPRAYYQTVNVEGTRALAESALRAGCERFVHISSIRAHGMNPGKDIHEGSPLPPDRDAYSDTKRQSDELVSRLARENGLPAVIVRPTQIYGPGDEVWTLGPLRLLRRGMGLVADGGRGMFCPMYIDDAAEGVLRAALLGRPGEAYNLCGQRAVSFREYFDCLAEIAGVPPPGSLPGWLLLTLAHLASAAARLSKTAPRLTPAQVRSITVSSTYSGEKARRELGFEPQVTLEEGMRRLKEWAEENQNLFAGHRPLVG